MHPPKIELGSGDTCRVTGELTFATVPAFWVESRAALAKHPHMDINLEGVVHADSAGVALLIEWLRAARAQGHSVVFRNVPAQMRDTARLGGVDTLLPLAQ